MKFSILFLILLPIIEYAGAQNTYSIFMPKYLRPGFEIEMVAEILKNPNPVRVEATLDSTDKAFSTSLEAEVEAGASRKLVFNEVIPVEYDGPQTFNLTVVGVDSVTNEELFRNTSDELEFQTKAFSIFIQSDKAIYQPSQTIKFRAVVTKPDLRPLSGTVTYTLEDPDSNVVMLEKDAPLVKGTAGSEFVLSKYATLGDWKLTYEVHNYAESLILTVEEYKLPKFEVEIKPDKTYLYENSTDFTGQIVAKFTFGKPVKGQARLEVKMQQYSYYYYWMDVEREQTPEPISAKFPDFNGQVDFTVPVNTIKNQFDWNPAHGNRKLEVTAYVLDKNSMVELNATTTIDLVKKRLKVEPIAKPEYAKPGLPYKAYIKVSEYDGALLSDIERESIGLQIVMTISYPYNSKSPKESQTSNHDLSIRNDGIAVLDVTIPQDDFQSLSFDAKLASDPDEWWASWYPTRFKSPSNTFLQISTTKSTFSVGEMSDLDVFTTQKATAYSVLLMSRGKIVGKEEITPSEYEEEGDYQKFKYDFAITSEMSPSIYVVISFMLPDGEVVADSVKLLVQASFLNKVTMSTSTSETSFGEPVQITVNADAGSLVGLRAIDRSVLLLKEGNDITAEKIFTDLDRYGDMEQQQGGWGGFPRFFICYFPVYGSNVPALFDNTGLLVFTDSAVFTNQSAESTYYNFGMEEEIMFNMAVDVQADSGPMPAAVPAQSSEPKVRKNFPETWIWLDSSASSNGTVTFTHNTPDTMTTWEISSFAVSDTTGLGVAMENAEITVFRNFFLSVNLPPTMVRGETLLMRVTVNNYFNTDLSSVRVTLADSEWYEVVDDGTKSENAEKIINVPMQDGVTAVYKVKFRKVGLARISLKAVSELAGDAVEKTIVIKAEGRTKTISHNALIDRADANAPPSIKSYPITIPQDVIEDSTRIYIAVSGNILSNALNNLGNLLKMPYGCGEQNMLNFAPDVFISLYLSKVNRLSGEVATKAKSHIREGYSRELSYQHDDGSFSAFGNSDHHGSTWLTAFVTKCFIAATQLDWNIVQERKVTDAADFLMNQQRGDGTFKELGKVSHKEMQSGVKSDETMTSYVLISITEGSYFSDNERVSLAASDAKRYLENRLDSVDQTYALAVMAYALALTDSAKIEEVCEKLEGKAEESDGMKFWRKEKLTDNCEKGAPCIYNDKIIAADVETTAYVLLTLMRKGEDSGSLMPIVKWLIKQRGANGGYFSTQDTVMAIQALSTFAGLFSDRERDIEMEVTHSAVSDFTVSFEVNENNALVLQMADLPNEPGNVTITTNGRGFADMQLNIIYNLPIKLVKDGKDEPFFIDNSVLDQDNTLIVTTCSRINEEYYPEGTGMVIMTVNAPSGYTLNENMANEKNKVASLVEFDGSMATGYFDKLNEPACLELEFEKFAEVEGVKPQSSIVMDYYRPDRMALQMYKIENVRNVNVCDFCPYCQGCGGGAGRNMVSHILTIVTFLVFLLFINP